MHVEAGDRVEDGGIGHIDRNVVAELRQHVRYSSDAVFKQQDRLRREVAGRVVRGCEHA